MADEEPDSEDRLPIDRRDFINLGIAGAAIEGGLVDRYVGSAVANSAESMTLGDEVNAALRPPPSHRRDYFPIVADHVSVGGLAPDPSTSVGSAAHLSDGRFSVAELHDAYEVGHDPTSVRELTTPQIEGPSPIARIETWQNWLEDYTVTDAKDLEITGNPDAQRTRLIQLVVRKAREKFRAVGSGHSHSEAAQPREYYSDLKQLSGTLDQPWLKDADHDFWDEQGVDRDKLVRLQAGTILKKINRDILPSNDLALQNMGSWDGQTLAGAINTSTHGTGLDLGTFADLVRSVEIVTVPESQYESGDPHIRAFRIEPDQGITDPEKFAQDAGDHDTVLVQDTDIFRSVVVGYGAMGIVHSYTLELRSPYWLKEKNTISQWGSFSPKRWAESNRHFNFLVDLIEPQLNGTSTPKCLLRTRNLAPVRDRDPTERANVKNAFEHHMDQILNAWEDIDNIQDVMNSIEESWETIVDIDVLDLAGYDPPFVGGYDESIWYIALRRKKEKNPDPNVPPEPPMDAITTEVGVPVSQVVPAVNTVINHVQSQDRFFPAPLGVRFTDKSHQYLSPEYERPTAMLEFIIPQPSKLQEEIDAVKIKETDDPLKIGPIYTKPKKIFYQKLKKIAHETGRLGHFLDVTEARKEMRAIEQKLVRRYDGRPHLGKFNTVHVGSGKDYMKPQNMFPEYGKWEDAELYLNKFGTFDGQFTDNKVRY